MMITMVLTLIVLLIPVATLTVMKAIIMICVVPVPLPPVQYKDLAARVSVLPIAAGLEVGLFPHKGTDYSGLRA